MRTTILIGAFILISALASNEAKPKIKTPSWVLGIAWAVMFFLVAKSQGRDEQLIYFQF